MHFGQSPLYMHWRFDFFIYDKALLVNMLATSFAHKAHYIPLQRMIVQKANIETEISRTHKGCTSWVLLKFCN
jgi:hypothetical protein